MKAFMRVTCVAVLTWGLMGCQTRPERADQFTVHPGFPENWGKASLLYLPSRILDALDVIHFGVAVGPGLGAEVQLTRPVSLGAVIGVDAGVAWLGRNTNPLKAALYARANAIEYRALAKKGQVWRLPYWDLGVRLHGLWYDGYVGIAIDELVDLVAGFVLLDLKADDFGCDRSFPTANE